MFLHNTAAALRQPAQVLTQLQDLPEPERSRAEAAFQYLMSADSGYATWIREHRQQLAAGEVGALLPPTFLLRSFLEAALWPDLYWCRGVCDTTWSSSKYMSVKKSFIMKTCCSILDYADDFDLLHLHYDRQMLARFSGRARAAPFLAFKWVRASAFTQ